MSEPTSVARAEAAGGSVLRRADRTDALWIVAATLAAMWVLELINSLDSYGLDTDGGIRPRNVSHLYAILTAPFLHASFSHILGNTVPFAVLGMVVALSGVRRLVLVTVIAIVVSGLGTWLTAASNSSTVGVSGVIFGYATYLISRGIFNRHLVETAVGVLVGLIFGGALLWGLVPHSGISWEDHLFGGIGGVVAAFALSARRSSAPRTSLPRALQRV